MLEDCVPVKTRKKYKTVLAKIVKQFFVGPLVFQQDENNKMSEYLKKDCIKEHWI